MAKFLFTHFWLLCGAWVGGVGALFLRRRLRRAAQTGELENAAVSQFAKAWFLALMVPCAILWLIQLSAGPVSSPDYLRWPAPHKWIALGVNVACWILLLWWVWLSNGAQVLSRMLTLSRPKYYPAFLYSSIAIKAITLCVVVMGVVAISGVISVHA